MSIQEVYDTINIIPNKGSDISITCQEFIVANREPPRASVRNAKKERSTGHEILSPYVFMYLLSLVARDVNATDRKGSLCGNLG